MQIKKKKTFVEVLAKITLKAGENFANSGCRLIYHQPTVLEKLKKK